MAKKIPQPTTPPRERAFLAGVELHDNKQLLSLEDSLAELALLADTAGVDVVGEITQKLSRPHVETYIGPGKVEELKLLSEETLAEVVIFDDELSPRHQRELEKALGKNIRVIDRTALILDIFAQHAHTKEGMLQVELAQYEYNLPRLTRAWTHLERQAGGGGGRAGSTGGVGLRGPGETQLEVDRRTIRKRISHIKTELEKVEAHRLRYRAQRKRSRIPTVALVGYTNAGKSTLLNRLAKADVYVANQLFATLDPTTRRVQLPGDNLALITDTVGFIQKLPTALIAAFHATLEEIAEADLLLHMVDISHPNALGQYQAVLQTLEEIGANHIPMITALNKADQLKDPENAARILENFPKSVAISALKGTGIDNLLMLVQAELFEAYEQIGVRLPYKEGALISLFHELGQVERVEHERGGVIIHGSIPGRLLAQFAAWKIKPNSSSPHIAEEENDLEEV
ncbi:MAG: GTPase HflX [Anaerolineales bacterium]|uniref:GTPase HflX n=1 Tax=Candidatus Villigracilis vicinus TaxID=3140679 RepID=UPI003136820A|nr:GTPase HflX [Anaerolineales bacterium]